MNEYCVYLPKLLSMLSNDICYGTSEKIILEGYKGAKTELLRQVEWIKQLDSKATTLLGIMITITIAIAGAFYAYISSDNPRLFEMVLISIAFTATALSCILLVFGVISGRRFNSDGDTPEYYFNDEVVDWIDTLPGDVRDGEFFSYRITVMQKEIDENFAEIRRMSKHYRLAVRIWCVTFAILGLIYMSCGICQCI